jgi:hypothetical protein
LARLLRYIHRRVSRYAPLDVPCRRTQIRRNLVDLFLAVTLNNHRLAFISLILNKLFFGPTHSLFA